MINEEKRREIVGNLRYCAEMCHSTGVLDSDVLNALDIHCGDTDGVSSAYDVEKLADLIDPTCHLVGTTSEEGLYGPTIFHHELSCGHTCHTDCPEPPAYCYECGCRVVEKEKDDD